MLVYCNQLDIGGSDGFENILGAIAGWLKLVTKQHFTIDDLISGDSFEINRKHVRTYKADASYPKLYSILFSNPDNTVKGRQWITEMSITVEEDTRIVFSLLLETSDVSALVRDETITTRPKVVGFIKENCKLIPTTKGLSLKRIGADEAGLSAFSYEIDSSSRKAPIVLISHKFDGEPYIDPEYLQEQLLGLAQVVVCEPEMDSWQMERVLTKRYSAWDGAINIIYPPFSNNPCRSKIWLSDELDSLLKDNKSLSAEILSHITHFSNGRKKRSHFSPHDVRAKRISDQRRYLQNKVRESKDSSDYEELLVQAFAQIDEHEAVLKNAKESFDKRIEEEQYQYIELEEKLSEADLEIRTLKFRIESESSSQNTRPDNVDDVEALKVFESVKNPTPANLLRLIKQYFSHRVIILDSAWKAAEKSESFRNGQKLAHLLYRLLTEYFDSISSNPEAKAKKVFTDNEFAAKESETVRSSPDLRRKREFEYNGETIQMYRHIKIGIADSIQDTIRVHFHWDAANHKIIIGYCGAHLPLS